MSSAYNQYFTWTPTTTSNTIYIPNGTYVMSGSGAWIGAGGVWMGTGTGSYQELMKIPDTDISYELIEYPAQRFLPPIYTIKKELESNLFDWIIIQYLKTQGRIREVD